MITGDMVSTLYRKLEKMDLLQCSVLWWAGEVKCVRMMPRPAVTSDDAGRDGVDGVDGVQWVLGHVQSLWMQARHRAQD
jgi:hypothetical protein